MRNPPAPFRGATRLWGDSSKSCNLASCIPFNPLSFRALHPLHPFLAFFLSACCLFGCTNPHGASFYHPLPRYLRFWAPPPTSRNPFKSRRLTSTANINKKTTPRYQTRFQKVSKSIPKLIELCQKSKV